MCLTGDTIGSFKTCDKLGMSSNQYRYTSLSHQKNKTPEHVEKLSDYNSLVSFHISNNVAPKELLLRIHRGLQPFPPGHFDMKHKVLVPLEIIKAHCVWQVFQGPPVA